MEGVLAKFHFKLHFFLRVSEFKNSECWSSTE